MDTIFKRSKDIYNEEILLVISHIFKLMENEKDEVFRNHYYEGLQLFLIPLHQQIRDWIHKEFLCL